MSKDSWWSKNIQVHTYKPWIKYSKYKIFQFCSSFDTTEFCSVKITSRCESDTLDDNWATLCPKMPLLEAVNTYDLSVRVQSSSLDLPLVTARDIIRRERGTTCTPLDQQGKDWSTKAQQDWPVNVIINNRILDKQGIKVWWTKDTSTSS
jgi:hypothetical protein